MGNRTVRAIRDRKRMFNRTKKADAQNVDEKNDALAKEYKELPCNEDYGKYCSNR